MSLESETPEQIMAWLAGLLCGVCGGTGHRPGIPDFEGSRDVATQSECDCHGTGRLLWRLVQLCDGWWVVVEDHRATVHLKPGYLLGTQIDAIPPGVMARREHGNWCCGDGNGLVTVAPTLEILIDTGLDLGFATVFTPEAWDKFLPESWIMVSGTSKVEQLLRSLEVAVVRKGMAT